MNQDILLSKIVPNPTDTAWAQAYTTLNVYITLSIENGQSKTPVTSYGKDLLEKLQREFFALDDKSLDNIKKAVGNVSKTITDDYKYSILVGAIVKDILYIVIASKGQVVIRRDGKAGAIATGVEGELHGFSGKLKHNDIIVLESGGFAEKLPLSSLSEYLSETDVSQIAENITPLTHEGANGTESAIILQYKDVSGVEKSTEDDFVLNDETEEKKSAQDNSERPEDEYSSENLWTKPPKENRGIEEMGDDDSSVAYGGDDEKPKRRLSFPSIHFGNKRLLLIGVILLLGALILGGVAFQMSNKAGSKAAAEFVAVYAPAKEKYEHGVSLEPYNETLALEEYNAALQMVNDALKLYPPDSNEYKQLIELKTQIEKEISSLGGGGSAENVKTFLEPGDKLKSITAITAKGGMLLVLDKEGKQVVTVDDDGSIDDTYDTKSSDSFISADDKYIYTMGSTATRIDRGNGTVTELTDEIEGSAFDIFGTNMYTLNTDDISKYVAPDYTSASYFGENKPSFKSTPVGMSISGPIWVIESDGSIERFTKGVKDDFSVSGLQAPIGQGASIYADPESTNIYILDIKNQRVVVLNDEGTFQTQYEGSFIKDAKSFAVDEETKTGFIVSGGKITSFDL